MAVMKRIDSGRGKMCRLQSVVLFFLVFYAETALANPRSCELIKGDIESRGILNAQVLSKPQNGSICGEGSCCSPKLEEDLEKFSRLHMDKYVRDSIIKVAMLIETRAKKFDEIFRDMFNRSKLEFHTMFERTYGKIYLDNADVFSDFFNELETYYKKGSVFLTETMDTFFGILYQKMFTVLNAQYQFDDKYLSCVTEHMIEMKPFGDVPHKLTHQLRRSFIATRTLYKTLTKAAEAARAVATLGVDDECSSSMTVMQHCGHCGGESGAGACWRYCADTVTSCLSQYIQLSDSWDAFVDAIEKVADRLLGPYNIESVVEPLNIKVSEAIMIFQENGKEVSQRIYTKCGKPTLSRPTRKAVFENPPEDPKLELTDDPLKMTPQKKKHKKSEKPDSSSSLDKMVTDIKTKVKDTKKFWLQLPYQYCSNESISVGPSETGNCWNGTMVGSYDQTTPKPTTTQTALITAQIFTLNGLTDKLRKAYQGVEVDMIDDTEEPFAGSGSGSGDGDDQEDDGDDDEDRDYEPTIHKEKDQSGRMNGAAPTIPPWTSTSAPEVVRTSSANTNTMSLTRALVQYLLPLVMVWFGGAIKDLL